MLSDILMDAADDIRKFLNDEEYKNMYLPEQRADAQSLSIQLMKLGDEIGQSPEYWRKPGATQEAPVPNTTVILGAFEMIQLENVPSLGEVLRRNQAWDRNYATLPDKERETMVENALGHYHIVAADIIHKLDIAGYDVDSMSEETGLRGQYVNNTIKALFLTAKDEKEKAQDTPLKEKSHEDSTGQ